MTRTGAEVVVAIGAAAAVAAANTTVTEVGRGGDERMTLSLPVPNAAFVLLLSMSS